MSVQTFAAEPVVVCSNRGPVTATRTENGDYRFDRTRPNGLVPVVFPAFAAHGGTWVYAARSEADKEIAGTGTVRLGPVDGSAATLLRPVDLPEALERRYYQQFCVDVLAKTFHYLHDLTRVFAADHAVLTSWDSYQEVNRLFAGVLAEHHGGSTILVQDYHLLLVAAGVRKLEAYRATRLVYFHHVAWCDPDYFGVLPEPVRRTILEAMTAFDVLAFHTRRWADAFLACCRRYLPGAEVTSGLLQHGGRTSRIIVAPAAVDPDDLHTETKDARYLDWCTTLRREAGGRWTLTRVERADLWKNPLRGLLSVERFLGERADAVGRVWFPWVLTPTRAWAPEYQGYLEECRTVAERINRTHRSAPGGPPVRLFIADDPARPDRALALALLTVADSVMTAPIFDGLNITAKEAALLNDADPVMIVSENAGVGDELGDAVLRVNPFDVGDAAAAIARAYAMAPAERRRRGRAVAERVRSRTPHTWLADLLTARPADPRLTGIGAAWAT